MDDSDVKVDKDTESDSKVDSDITSQDITTTGFHKAMAVLRGKYTLAILHTLRRFGVVRFNDMRRYMRTLTYKTLSTTLKDLQDAGLVLRTEYAQIPPRVEYSLTDLGKTLFPILDALDSWGAEYALTKAKTELAEEVETATTEDTPKKR